MKSAQMSIDFARAQREVAIQRVQDAAERRSPGWTDLALQFLALYAMRHPVFSSEDVLDASIDYGLPQPHDARAWGAVYRAAERRGVIRRSSIVYLRRRGHCSPALKWESAIFGRQAGQAA